MLIRKGPSVLDAQLAWVFDQRGVTALLLVLVVVLLGLLPPWHRD